MKNDLISRRTFAGALTAGAAAISTLGNAVFAQDKTISMYKDLGCGHIGVDANQKKAAEYAAQFGFGGVDPSEGELVKMSPAERQELVAFMKSKNIKWGCGSVPVDFRGKEDAFKKGMQVLPEQAKVLQEVGATRVATWIMPGTNNLTYLENFKMHATRLREIAKVYKDHGIRIGLEFVGPLTIRKNIRYPFAHTQKEMLELCDEIGTGNTGLLFDCFHWFTSHGTVDEILSLKNEQIILVHVNDGVKDRSADEQIDSERRLPTTTGVIDLKGFINALAKIGYDGPVECEPFDKRVRELDNEAALKETIESLNALWGLIEK